MSTVRQRRLINDYSEVQEYIRNHPRIRISQVEGSPPERYEIVYRICSLVSGDREPSISREHLVEVTLSRNYPRTPPKVCMQVAVFHPNVDESAIYFSEHWTAETSLKEIVIRIGEILAFQRYDLASAVNRRAVKWIHGNIDRLPLDEIDLHGDAENTVSDNVPTKPKPQAETTPSLSVPALEPAPDAVKLICPSCHSTYFVRQTADGKKVQCKKCKKIFLVKL